MFATTFCKQRLSQRNNIAVGLTLSEVAIIVSNLQSSPIVYHSHFTPMNYQEMTYYVMFNSEELEIPEYIGPFYSEEDASDYADYQNNGLALAGVPGWKASYGVV